MPHVSILHKSIKYTIATVCITICLSTLLRTTNLAPHLQLPTLPTHLFQPPPLEQNPTVQPANMAWRCSGRTNSELISNLFKAGLISSPRVRDAMASVDRAHYCADQRTSYEDSPQGIGFSATISAPHMHALASESLERMIPEDSDRRVLDIGSGSGYLTHVLANLVCGGEGRGAGKVVGIDHIQGLVDMARANVAKSEEGRRLLDAGKVEFVLGDGRKGCPEHGPYDAIHVGAAAAELHQDLVDQLKSPGRMFIPVEDRDGWGSQWIWVVDKDESGTVTKQREMGVRYVPLTDKPRDV